MQSIFALRSAPAGLKLTTAKFYSPRNRPYSEQGVKPDLPIKTRVAAKPAGTTRTPRRSTSRSSATPSSTPSSPPPSAPPGAAARRRGEPREQA